MAASLTASERLTLSVPRITSSIAWMKMRWRKGGEVSISASSVLTKRRFLNSSRGGPLAPFISRPRLGLCERSRTILIGSSSRSKKCVPSALHSNIANVLCSPSRSLSSAAHCETSWLTDVCSVYGSTFDSPSTVCTRTVPGGSTSSATAAPRPPARDESLRMKLGRREAPVPLSEKLISEADAEGRRRAIAGAGAEISAPPCACALPSTLLASSFIVTDVFEFWRCIARLLRLKESERPTR
mmetsp:Transcript_22929/g.58971  ORF Transcript_22929/g.58971 Transcript_22929/m.58971 type:complete len:242 (-) Transcript_22929:139-864(-)